MNSLSFKKSPSLPFVELRHAVSSSACFHAHTHDEFSFGVIDQGSAIYQNQKHNNAVGEGVTVTINPGDVHACNPNEGSWSYRMIFVDSQWISCLQDETGYCSSFDYSPFVRQLYLEKHVGRSVDNLYRSLSMSKNELQAETDLIEVLTELISPPNSVRHRNFKEKQKMKIARDILLDETDNRVTLNSIAETIGLSRYQFIRAFRNAYGQTPHAYLIDYRIKQAKHFLQQGRTLSTIAFDLGFADQAHFQRHFKRRLAVTPKQYQSFFNDAL